MTDAVPEGVEALAARVEALTGPSREVDGLIVQLVFGWEQRVLGGVIPWYDPEGEMHASPPRFTASLDAALTLVPEGCVFNVMADFGLPGRARLWGMVPPTASRDRGWSSDAATPALALCAASLRARASAEAA